MFFKQNWGFLTQIGGGGLQKMKDFFLPKLRGFDQNLRVFFKHNLTLFFFLTGIWGEFFYPWLETVWALVWFFYPKSRLLPSENRGGVGGVGSSVTPILPVWGDPSCCWAYWGILGWGWWDTGDTVSTGLGVNGILGILGLGVNGDTGLGS